MFNLKATFDFDLYVVDPEDQIFIPASIWPKHPQRILSYPPKQLLSKTTAYSQIQLTKQFHMERSESCDNTEGYVYGGKILTMYKGCQNIIGLGKTNLN